MDFEAYQAANDCDICGARPDRDGDISHGRGCYVASADGGGTTSVEPFAPEAISVWDYEADLLSPVVLGQGKLTVIVALDNHVLAKGELADRFSHVGRISVQVVGRDARTDNPISETRAVAPWQTVEDIARWVEGDGTDPQRSALADGIRERRFQ